MEERLKHFSHEHPLCIFHVDEDPKPHRCHICCLPILSTPSYTCSVNAYCNFFLHKPCAHLPEKFDHELHGETLCLEKSMLQSCRSFRYRCWKHSHCEFDLHPLVAKPVEIKTHHKSHWSHPLVAFCQEIVSLCNVCGEEERGFFYHCQVCNFWIHQNCTILPTFVKSTSHPHQLVVAYSLPYPLLHSSAKDNCLICGGEWRLPNGGKYFCLECNSSAHVACAMPRIENIMDESEIVHLPDEEDTFPSLAIRRLVEINLKNRKIDNKMMTIHHQHPLILENGCSSNSTSSDENVVCDVCIQPIKMMSFPFYRCVECHFVAHPICANLVPDSFETFVGPERLVALLNVDHMESYFNSVIPCGVCYRPSNGISYKVIKPSGEFTLVGVECAFTPMWVQHASHKQHLLFLAPHLFSSPHFFSSVASCCSVKYNKIMYRCVACDYSIHVGCAQLPRTTSHKSDDHPLELITNHNKLQDLFCVICEQQIELIWWYYGCTKCEHYFHINCIPSVGFMSKVKFGKTHVDHNLHHHPLTLTRMLTHRRNEECGLCNQIIKGFSDDEMALHCSPCSFWLHFSCAAATTPLKDFSKILQEWRRNNN